MSNVYRRRCPSYISYPPFRTSSKVILLYRLTIIVFRSITLYYRSIRVYPMKIPIDTVLYNFVRFVVLI
jgi:hypothetical protein